MATEASQVIVEFTKYFNAGDLEGSASLYEEGAALLMEPTSKVGDADVRTVLSAYLGMKGTMTIEKSAAFVLGDLALTHNQLRLEAPGAEPMTFASAELARRQPDGTWRYVIDNPFGAAVLG